MFRVGDNLRSINPEAYDPEIIAIRPFHRRKPNLQHKFSLFNMIKINYEDIIIFLVKPLLQNSIFRVKDLPTNAHHLLGIQFSSFATVLSQMDTGNPDNVANINSAVELKKAGISIQKSEYHSLFQTQLHKHNMLICI
ncbi:unnamed protein product [Fraxinus pennsylvanica]|uniref:Uncharacterized protein n=1 Tax=Fraxinus pennsylvanica TaxID=56036 RepID=A0AAD2E4N4_9LAMI|nr:unnamed protein product [Fraxinus pennsylvanica]